MLIFAVQKRTFAAFFASMKTNFALIVLAFVTTPVLILSGIDWFWAKLSETYPFLTTFFLPSVPIGIFLPLIFCVLAYFLRHRYQIWRGFWQHSLFAFWIALLLSSILKGITNRVYRYPFQDLSGTDFSGDFRFGCLAGDSIWTSLTEGYPSGHTITAAAMCLAWLPHLDRPYQRWAAVLYPIYIGIGMSFTEHWLSDVITSAFLAMALVRFLQQHNSAH